MNAKELFRAGKLDEAVQALNVEVRDNPSDKKSRIFLFELLCFSGQYERAEKQLGVLAQESNHAELGALLYLTALHAERSRQDLFRKKEYPKHPTESSEPRQVSGVLNGRPFRSLADADPTIGARLEVFAAGSYMWIPFEHLASVEVPPPRRLRDLLWIPAAVRTGPTFKGLDLGEVLLPAMTPFSWQHADDAVRLGHETQWQENEDGKVAPVGQKILFVDGEEFPFLELRKLEFASVPAVA